MEEEVIFPSMQDILGDHIAFEGDELGLTDTVKLVEEKINEGGWDQRPIVATILGTSLGAEILGMDLPEEIADNFGIAFPALVNEMVRLLWEHKPGDELVPLLQGMMDEAVGGGFQGILMSVEGWGMSEPDKEKEPELHAAFEKARLEGNFAAYPRSVEARDTWIVSPVSEMFWVHRNRGQEPEYTRISGEQWHQFRYGRLIEASRNYLRVLLTLMQMKGLTNDAVTEYWKKEHEREH